jgi:hypothetical protein
MIEKKDDNKSFNDSFRTSMLDEGVATSKRIPAIKEVLASQNR